MKKTKVIRHSDPRPRLRNTLRAADELIKKKGTYVGPGPTYITTGPDWILTGGPCPCTTLETFTRTEADSLGTSEFGPEWAFFDHSPGSNEDLNAEVDGTHARFFADFNESSTGTYSVGMWGNGLTLPVELKTKIKFRWQYAGGSNWTVVYGISTEEDWFDSDRWEVLIFFPDFDNGIGDFGGWDIMAESEMSFEQGFTDPVIITTIEAVEDESAWYEVELWSIFRIDQDGFKGKVWETSGSEPGPWTLTVAEDPSEIDGLEKYLLVSLFGVNAGSVFFGNNNEFFVDSMEITEGDVDCICEQQSLNSGTAFAFQMPFDPSNETLGATISGILVRCTRIDATHYELPSDALYIKNLYIDHLQPSGASWDFDFNSGSVITFISAISIDAEVWARYVPSV